MSELATESKWRSVFALIRLDRPIGIYLLLWPTLWALWIATKGIPDLPILGIFIMGVVLMRSAGCVINDLADRHFDGHVSRTRERPLVTGRISPREAIIVFSSLCFLAGLLALQLNHMTQLLSCIAVFLAMLYPFMKRYTYWPQFFLGAAYAWAIPMAFAAEQSKVPMVAGILYVVTLMWAIVYDTMYAMIDREEDKKIGIKSTAILFGRYDRMWIGFFQTLVILGLIIIGQSQSLPAIYYVSISLGSGLFCYQQYLLKGSHSASYLRAFKNNHWFGCIIFLGILLSYAMK